MIMQSYTMRHFKADLFKVLSHSTRIRILDALRDGELTVGEIQDLLQIEQSSTSQHLAALRANGFVVARRQGTSVWYSVVDKNVWKLLDVARDIYERHLQNDQASFEALR